MCTTYVFSSLRFGTSFSTFPVSVSPLKLAARWLWFLCSSLVCSTLSLLDKLGGVDIFSVCICGWCGSNFSVVARVVWIHKILTQVEILSWVAQAGLNKILTWVKKSAWVKNFPYVYSFLTLASLCSLCSFQIQFAWT